MGDTLTTSTGLLPFVAPGHCLTAWQGMMLALPEEWNLRQHEGDWDRGMLVFADLRRPRLEVRWRTPRRFGWRLDPRQVLKKKAAAIRHRRKEIVDVGSGAVRVQLPQGTLLLAADAHRMYELHWLTAPDDPADMGGAIETMTSDFLHALGEAHGRQETYWSVYGASGWIPAKARLQNASLLPGATSLTFTHGKSTLTLGAYSMAERLLSQAGSLHQWATKTLPMIAACPRGAWKESPDEVSFHADARRRFCRVHHAVTIQHDPAANRILWTHQQTPKRS